MDEASAKRLFLSQKETLDTFLKSGALTPAQYEKSLTTLAEKMGMSELLEKEKGESSPR